jgi:hypothetical protein
MTQFAAFMFGKSIAKRFESQKLQIANQKRHTENCDSNDRINLRPAIFVRLLVMVAFGVSHARGRYFAMQRREEEMGEEACPPLQITSSNHVPKQHRTPEPSASQRSNLTGDV